MSNKPPRDRSRDTQPQLERAPPAVGDSVTFTKTITTEDVCRFARVTGETNRLYLDDEFAARTRFEGRIIPERLLAGLISAAISRFPELSISLSQQVEFLAPARPGEMLKTVCEIVEDIGEQRYRLRTFVYNEADDRLIDGEAIVLIDDRPEPADPTSP